MDRDMVRDRKNGFDQEGAGIGQQEVTANDNSIREGGSPGRFVEGEIVVTNSSGDTLSLGTIVSHRSTSRGENAALMGKIAADCQVARATDAQVGSARLKDVA